MSPHHLVKRRTSFCLQKYVSEAEIILARVKNENGRQFTRKK